MQNTSLVCTSLLNMSLRKTCLINQIQINHCTQKAEHLNTSKYCGLFPLKVPPHYHTMKYVTMECHIQWFIITVNYINNNFDADSIHDSLYQFMSHYTEIIYNSIIHNSSIFRYIYIYKIMLGIQETNNVCLYVGVLAISDTIALCVMTFPNCTGGAPCVLLALLLGAGDSGGLHKTFESLGMGDSKICWLELECGSIEASVSVNTLSDA